MIRKIISVIIGYAFFVMSSIALFKISNQQPHAVASNSFIIFSTIIGMLFSVASGYFTQLISKAKHLNVNYILALIIAGVAAYSLTKSTGNHWTQVLAIAVFAPISIFGGMLAKRKL